VSSSQTHAPWYPAGGSLPLIRWAALLGLLLIELAGLTTAFEMDVSLLVRDARWWTALVVSAAYLLPMGIASAGAVLILGRGRLRDDLAALSERRPESDRAWPWLVGHLAALAVFVLVTGLITRGALEVSAHPGFWALFWAAAGSVVFGCWAAAVLRPGHWPALVRRAGGRLLAGVLAGATAWGVAFQANALWDSLGWATLRVVRVLLGLLSAEVVCRPEASEIGIGGFSVTIASGCSGCEGIGLLWTFLALYFWRYRADLRFPHALLMIPVGTVVIWLANAVRLIVLIMLGAWVSPELAMGAFHSQAGWIGFTLIAMGIVLATRALPWMRAPTNTPVGPEGPGNAGAAVNPAAEYLVPLIVLVGTTTIAGAFTVGLDQTYPLRVLATAGALWAFRRRYAATSWSCSWAAVGTGVLTFLIWIALEPAASSSGAALAADLAGVPRAWAAAWLALRVAGSVVAVPLAEELAFRGFLTRRLISADFESVPPGRFTWFSFLASSSIFGALHGRWLAGTLAGSLFALAYYRRGRIADPVWAHATANALIAADVLATGSWSLWA
jgi:exosortase E/protease (VPEID-CTERM system)